MPDDPRQAAELLERRERQIVARTVDPVVAAREHFKTEARMMYEQGQSGSFDQLGISVVRDKKGHITFDIPDELLRRSEALQKGKEKQELQAKTLREWLDYINGPDTNYPDWFKYYAIDGVLKLGAFDKEKGRFSRRDSDSLAPYPALSRGALAKVRSWVEEVRIGKLKVPNEFTDEGKQQSLKAAVSGGNFGQLYVLALESINEGTISDELRHITDGAWKVYGQGSDPIDLYADLQGFGLDWCTSTDMSYTRDHVDGGDFYVYYSEDELGNPRVPRIAIRMENGVVREVRGINHKQELEPGMADIVAEKLKALPGGEQYVRRAEDMKHLTNLESALNANPDTALSSDDLAFLYELNRNIDGFGYERDPRIDAIKASRGERDIPEIIRLLPEILAAQAESSYKAYSEVASQLGAEIASEQEFTELLANKMQEWRENGVMDYLVRDFVENGNKPNLLATPNIIADWQQLRQVAVNFGKNQPYETYVYDDLYRHYAADELSGQPTDGKLRFSVMPSGYTRRLGQATVDDQLATLTQLQAKQPGLGIRVPSVLEAITYWQTLRAKNGSVAGFDTTYIRHFDLGPLRFDSWSFVPGSYVDVGGTPYLVYSVVENGNRARVLVG